MVKTGKIQTENQKVKLPRIQRPCLIFCYKMCIQKLIGW